MKPKIHSSSSKQIKKELSFIQKYDRKRKLKNKQNEMKMQKSFLS